MSAGMAAIEAALQDKSVIGFMERELGLWSYHRIAKDKRGVPTERDLWMRWTGKDGKEAR